MTHFPAVVRGFSCFILLAGVSACTYLIPDDVSTPRHNIVQGDRHKPLRNSQVPQNTNTPQNGAALQPALNSQQAVAAAPVVPVAVNALAVPVPSTIQYPQLAAVVPPVTVPALTPRAGSPVGAPALQGASLRQIPAENPGAVAAVAAEAKSLEVASNVPVLRRKPAENAELSFASMNNAAPSRNPAGNGTFQVAQNSALNNVPARPLTTGPESSAARLGEVRKDMEKSRVETNNARDQLSRDVASEPSVFTKPAISASAPDILSPLPSAAAPSAPVPTPAMAPASPVPPSVTPPVPVKPASPEAMRAPAPMTASTAAVPAAPLAALPQFAQAPVQPTAAPAPKATLLPPIQLKAPAPMEVAAVTPVPPVTAVAKNAGGFDPMVELPPLPPAPAAAPTAPVLAPIALTPPPARVEQPVVARAPVAAPVSTNLVASNSAFNPLDDDYESNSKGRSLQYLSPSRYTYHR